LAAANYHDTYGVFPPGTKPSPVLAPDKRLSWMVTILPFVEQDNLWELADKEHAWDSDGNRLLATTELKVLMCPATPETARTPGLGVTPYIGMAGVGADAATLPLEDKRAGFFGYDRQIRIPDVRDGLSNTILAMETTSDLGPWAAGGPTTVRGLDPEDQPYLAVGAVFGVKHREDRFFRTNPVGSNIAIADGSVRWVLATINSQTLEALATIAGGDTPGDDY
jgi:uncharacterized protein DUF1559